MKERFQVSFTIKKETADKLLKFKHDQELGTTANAARTILEEYLDDYFKPIKE